MANTTPVWECVGVIGLSGKIERRLYSMKFFLYVLGLVLVVEGLPYFVAPQTVKEISKRIPYMEDTTLRGLGLTLILAGLAILYLASYLWSS